MSSIPGIGAAPSYGASNNTDPLGGLVEAFKALMNAGQNSPGDSQNPSQANQSSGLDQVVGLATKLLPLALAL